jgi:ribonuclease R
MNVMQNDIEGVVLGHRDGHGFVIRDDGKSDIFLPPREMGNVLHKDRVKVRISHEDRKGRLEGQIVEIVERSQQSIIGVLRHENGVWMVRPQDKRYCQDVLISQPDMGQAAEGQVVDVELTDQPALFGPPVGCIKEILGSADDPGMEIEIAVRKYNVPYQFSDACIALAHTLPDKVTLPDKQQRIDLTDIPFVTIDGEDARDFDDAVYCEPTVSGTGQTTLNNWRLLVAIADVSHYVENGSAIDLDAYERATSVYFPRRVIPMLPETLSNSLCSLKPQVERLCMVCDMLISSEGVISAYQFYAAVIWSHARLTYTQVAAMLSNAPNAQDFTHPERQCDLIHLHRVYQALLKSRRQRGAIDLDTIETQIVCDANGHIEKIMPKTRNDAHKLIEEAMLAANVCSANFIAHHKYTALYRVHGEPTPEKVEILRNYLKSSGVSANICANPTPADFQVIAKATENRPDAQQIHTMLLRTMQQAIYTPCNSGHFGLALEAYTHFTSPIRRYPDLLVHRVIKAILAKKKYHLPVLPTPGEAHARLFKRLQNNTAKSSQNTRKPSAEISAWQAAGLHCSTQERRADEASRDVDAWLKCKYIHGHLGEEFAGVVSTVTSFGLFVTLNDLYIEGLVHITELGGDYFQFDEMRLILRGERTGISYAIGTQVVVQVSQVDIDSRRIDFRLMPTVAPNAQKSSRRARFKSVG